MSTQQIEPQTYQAASWDYDASSIEAPALVIVDPDTGDVTGGIEYHS